MTKAITKDIRAAINSLIAFDARNEAHQETQAEYLAANIRNMRKGAQAVVAGYKGMKKSAREAYLLKIKCATLVGRANTNKRLAWEYLAGKDGAGMVQRAEKGQLGKADTILGAKKNNVKIVNAKNATPPQQRAPKSGQGKLKQVSFVANGKKPVTLADKLAALEAFAESQGFSFTDFVAEWTDEVEAGNTGKKAANG